MLGDRIKQARVAVGMTQDEVIAALAALGVSLTKGGLSKYERGGSMPRATLLRSLARVLGVESSFFLEEPRASVRWLAFRKKSRMGGKRQERVKALAEAQLEVILTLRHALEPARDEQAPPRKRVRTLEEAEAAAESVRAYWRLGGRPIPSVTAAIEDGGGIVVVSGGDDDLFDGLSGWVNNAVPFVVVSPAASDDRRRFSLAHELGHLFMEVRKVDASAEEKLAHRFAAAFLVPAETARRELGVRRRHLDFGELAVLKQKHGLSMQAWIFRAADLGIIEPAHARTLFAEMSARGWRRREPVELKGEEKPMRLWQLAVRALAEGVLSRSQAERVCPGVTHTMDENSPQPLGALDARTLRRLPEGERNKLMEQAAAHVVEEYKDGGGLSGFESFSEEDLFDNPLGG